MSERQIQQSDEVDGSQDVDLSVDVNTGVDESEAGFEGSADTTEKDGSSAGFFRSMYGRTLGRVLSSRGLVTALALALVFSFVFSLIPFVGLLGNLLGIGVAGFVYGLGSSNSRYLELLLAGAIIGGGSAVFGNLLVITFGSMTGLLGIGLLGGAVTAIGGHYFGRDFRDGLTRDIE